MTTIVRSQEERQIFECMIFNHDGRKSAENQTSIYPFPDKKSTIKYKHLHPACSFYKVSTRI